MVADTTPLTHSGRSVRVWPAIAWAAACWFVGGLAVSRLLYEGLFPVGGWLGRPAVALGLGAIAAIAGAVVAMRWRNGPDNTAAPRILAFTPLLLNLVWLLDPAVDLARGRFLFGASLWLVAVLLTCHVAGDADRRWRRLGPLFVAVGLLPIYLGTMSHAVGAADTFEFQVVAPQLGIAHPTGYPLYLLLGRLFSLLPFGTVAWRLNLASAVYAVIAAAVVFRVGLALTRRPLPALVGAVALGLIPVYWGQAIVAEVYTLHALFVAVALWLMVRLIRDGRRPADDRRRTTDDEERGSGGEGERAPSLFVTRHSSLVTPSAADRKTMVALAFVLGLGLANHLTTVFLLPPAAIAVALNLWPSVARGSAAVGRRRSLLLLFLQLLAAFVLPLLFYAYLPLRWSAVNDEPMGFGRFVEWVIGGRFQGALQWGAWLRDPTRRQIVGRLFLDAWGWFYLALAAVGLLWLFVRQWRAALVLLITAAGFTFYALNYYVPDLAVFLIPAHVVIAVWVAAGADGIIVMLSRGWRLGDWRLGTGDWEAGRWGGMVAMLVFGVVLLPALMAAGGRWSAVDQSGRDGGEAWARGVLEQPLARGAAILADSEKIAPLYYLQQIERLRPDLDIMVLPDEAAYRAELDARLAAGQTVYLARYLPGLEGIYHLRSAGPLVEVSREPLTVLPADTVPNDQQIGPLRLLGHTVQPEMGVQDATGLTLYWTLDRPLGEGELPPVIYLRRAGGDVVVSGVHLAGDTYPVNAWRSGEIVADYHLLPLPDMEGGETGRLGDWEIEVAVAPRFTPAADLDWQTVTDMSVAPRPGPVGAPRRAFFDGFALDWIEFPTSARPGTALPLRYSGYGDGEKLTFLIVPPHAVNSLIIPTGRAPTRRVESASSMTFFAEVDPATETGPHVLIAYTTGEAGAICGWLATPTTGCVVAEIDISGAALPEGAANFDDRIALLDLEVEEGSLVPGGQLPVTITWQALAEMDEDYTVFVQVLDAADRIVGQVDAWPVQGTRPTSTLRPGETITDPYLVQLDPNLPPGDYRVIAGLYLLATGQRLPVIDEAGDAVDDKVEVSISNR